MESSINSWRKDACNFTLADAEVHVWKADVLELLPAINYYDGLLDKEEEAKANQFIHEKERQQFIIRRGILRVLLGKYINKPPDSLQFLKGKRGKPELFGKQHIQLAFNLSYSHNLIVVAIASSAVGIDLEAINTTLDYSLMVQQFFNEKDKAFIFQNYEPVNAFYLLWTRKEAILKAKGEGLSEEGLFISCLDGENDETLLSHEDFKIKSFKIDICYMCSIAFKKNNDLKYFVYNYSA